VMVKFISETPVQIKKVLKNIQDLDPTVTDRRQLMHYFLEKKNAPCVILSIIENRFITAEKPFFNVYPKVAQALANTKLSIKPSDIPKSIIHDLPAISIRLPIGSSQEKNAKTNWFIISVFDGDPLRILNASGMNRFFGCQGKPFVAIYSIDESSNYIRLSTAPFDVSFDDADNHLPDQEKRSTAEICRIALGVMLLAADPDYIKPVLLKADEGKTTPIEERIARAKNRGVYGFTIGEEIERCPHFRRPHFAIRWTGKGAEIPKLVPVKGAIVGKEKMTTVPTGYEEQSDE